MPPRRESLVPGKPGTYGRHGATLPARRTVRPHDQPDPPRQAPRRAAALFPRPGPALHRGWLGPRRRRGGGSAADPGGRRNRHPRRRRQQRAGRTGDAAAEQARRLHNRRNVRAAARGRALRRRCVRRAPAAPPLPAPGNADAAGRRCLRAGGAHPGLARAPPPARDRRDAGTGIHGGRGRRRQPLGAAAADPRPGLPGPRTARLQGQLAERAAPALRDQGRAAGPAAAHVRRGRPARHPGAASA